MIVYIYNLKTNEKEIVYKNVEDVKHNDWFWFIRYYNIEHGKFVTMDISKDNRKIVVYGF